MRKLERREQRDGTAGPKVVEQLYTRDLLEDTFADFCSLDIREHDSRITEGAGHDDGHGHARGGGARAHARGDGCAPAGEARADPR